MSKKRKKNGNIIDRLIINPLTKFIVFLGKILDKIGKLIETLLTNPNILVFSSLFIALLIFIIIDQKIIVFTSQTAEVLKNQKVESTYNEELYVVEGLPKTVDITLMGNRSDLFIAKQSNTSKVTVDLTGLKPGSHKVNIEYSQPSSGITYSVNPSTANVNIYSKVSKSKTVDADILNEDALDSKYIITSVTPKTDKVVIKGTDDENAQNSLSKVAAVKALVDASTLNSEDAGKHTIKDVPLKAYDKNGKALNIEIVPNKINVDVDIESPSKELPIRVIPKGEIGFGKAISNITMNRQTVTAYGSRDVLDNLEYIPVEVNASNIVEGKEYKLDLTKPSGVKTLSNSSVTLSFTLGDETSKDVNDVNIDVQNLGDGYKVQGVTKDDIKVNVNIKGVSSVLNTISADDISAYIDLKDYEPGEYEVPVKVSGTDSRVTYVSKTKKVKVKIVEK